MPILNGLLGMCVLLFLAWLLSVNRRGIKFKTVATLLFLQAAIAGFVLYVPVGAMMLQGLSNFINSAIQAGANGVSFVFGPLTDTAKSNGFIFAVKVLAMIIFFAAFMELLFYLRIMPIIINFVGGGIRKLVKTSQAESFIAVANIFMGQTESPLTIKPYLKKVTSSELFVIMTCGMASVAGSVLAGYASLGIEVKYLIAAAFMSAPGGLLMAKIIMPSNDDIIEQKTTLQINKEGGFIGAISRGALDGLQMAACIAAMLIAFIGLITLFDNMLGSIGGIFGIANLSLATILGYLFAPIAFVIGIPMHEAITVGTVIGQKMVFNEFIAYINFVEIMKNLSVHSQIIAIFALCGFANIGSIGMQVGALGALEPSLKDKLAKFAPRAMLAATLSNLMSATLAGIFISL